MTCMRTPYQRDRCGRIYRCTLILTDQNLIAPGAFSMLLGTGSGRVFRFVLGDLVKRWERLRFWQGGRTEKLRGPRVHYLIHI